jgi:hypothetical protein
MVPKWHLGLAQDGVRPDAAPDDMRLCADNRGTIPEGGPPIICPGHLEDAGRAAYSLDPQTFAKAMAAAQVFDHLLRSHEKCGLLRGGQSLEVKPKAR